MKNDPNLEDRKTPKTPSWVQRIDAERDKDFSRLAPQSVPPTSALKDEIASPEQRRIDTIRRMNESTAPSDAAIDPTTPKPGQVSEKMQLLFEAIDGLGRKVCEIEAKLQPVLKPYDGPVPDRNTSDKAAILKLADLIASRVREINTITNKLTDLISRIDL